MHPVSPDFLLFISASVVFFKIVLFLNSRISSISSGVVVVVVGVLCCTVSVTYRSQCCVAGANRRAGIALVGGALE